MTEYAKNRLNEVFPLLEKAVSDAFDDGYRAARMQIQAERANVRGEWVSENDNDTTPYRWISVDDALPKFTGDVLVSVGINRFGEGMHNEARVAVYNTVLKRFTIHEHPNVYIGVITHWMPLPESPILEEEK